VSKSLAAYSIKDKQDPVTLNLSEIKDAAIKALAVMHRSDSYNLNVS
jgi:hypothetical protein